MDLGLEGTTAIVCGGSSGIGFAIASELRREGANVVISARREGPLEEAAQRIGAVGIAADLRQGPDLDRLADATAERFGGIDVIVNSGAFVKPTEVVDLDEENLAEAFESFLFSAIRLTKRALPHLIESGRGRVVNIAARAVREPNEHHATSAVSRLGLVGWSKMLSNEMAGKGLTVNTIASGWIDTEGVKIEAEQLKRLAPIPVGRPGTTDEMAAIVTFLASGRCGYLTGAVLPVDGGLTRFLL